VLEEIPNIVKTIDRQLNRTANKTMNSSNPNSLIEHVVSHNEGRLDDCAERGTDYVGTFQKAFSGQKMVWA